MIRVNLSRVNGTIKNQISKLAPEVVRINTMIDKKTGEGNDFLGWTTYVNELDEKVVKQIAETAKRIRKECEVLVVVGIGGSYLGARAAIDAINGIVNNSGCKVVYLGNTLSPTYTAQVMKSLIGKKIAVNVISKSGTTTEPAIAFRLVLDMVKSTWKKNYNKYVIATTDKARGALFQMAKAEGFETYVIPDDVGGRYSVFTPVGLIPMAVAGINIVDFLKGAKDGISEYSNPNLEENEAYKYAVVRHLERTKDKKVVEFFITYEPHFVSLGEWWKQLYGESEGKDGKGILPASLCFTTDLHSMGQFCQSGTDCFFETTIAVANYQDDIAIPTLDNNLDKLNYLQGKNISVVEDIAIQSTMDAHYIEGGHNNILIELDQMNAYTLGQLMFFFCKACAMSAYLSGVNPFNQPGVEVYKARMKKLLSELN